jgi:hypothetical protein
MLQSRLAQVGLSKQTAKGSAATEATYQVGVLGGTVAGVEVSESDLNPTASNRVLSYVERTQVTPVAGFDVVGMPRSIGLLLLAATGAVTTVAGVAPAPNTHTFKTADDLAYLTVFGRYSADHLKMADAKLDELELSWDKSGAIKAAAKLWGLNLEFLAAAYTVAANGDERPVDSNPLIGAGGLFEVDGATARVTAGSIKLANGMTPVPISAKVTPDDVFPGMQAVSVSLTVIPDDLATFRKVLTGTAAGTTISAKPYIGAIRTKFVQSADVDLEFNAGKAVLATEFPEAKPEGGPAEVKIEAKVLAPATGDPYTFVLRNFVASY